MASSIRDTRIPLARHAAYQQPRSQSCWLQDLTTNVAVTDLTKLSVNDNKRLVPEADILNDRLNFRFIYHIDGWQQLLVSNVTVTPWHQCLSHLLQKLQSVCCYTINMVALSAFSTSYITHYCDFLWHVIWVLSHFLKLHLKKKLTLVITANAWW